VYSQEVPSNNIYFGTECEREILKAALLLFDETIIHFIFVYTGNHPLFDDVRPDVQNSEFFGF
jgi:hypothetical protein